MKKLLGIVAASVLTVSAFGQGTVVFQNGTGLAQQWTSAANTTLITVPKSGAEIELFAASTSTSLNPLGTLQANGFNGTYTSMEAFLAANSGWSSIASTPILSLTAGNFSGGTVTIGNIAEAANANYIIVGWTGGYTSLDAALTADLSGNGTASFIGESALFTTTTGDPLTTPSGTATSLKGTFTGMTLAPMVVPEPASFALAGLGLAALLVFRRRN